MNRSNFLRLFLISVVLLLNIFITNKKVFGENWILYGISDDFRTKHYYDKDSLTMISPSVKRVWEKKIPPVEYKLKEREEQGLPLTRYFSYNRTLMFLEINCSDRTVKLLIFRRLRRKGSNIRVWQSQQC